MVFGGIIIILQLITYIQYYIIVFKATNLKQISIWSHLLLASYLGHTTHNKTTVRSAFLSLPLNLSWRTKTSTALHQNKTKIMIELGRPVP